MKSFTKLITNTIKALESKIEKNNAIIDSYCSIREQTISAQILKTSIGLDELKLSVIKSLFGKEYDLKEQLEEASTIISLSWLDLKDENIRETHISSDTHARMIKYKKKYLE